MQVIGFFLTHPEGKGGFIWQTVVILSAGLLAHAVGRALGCKVSPVELTFLLILLCIFPSLSFSVSQLFLLLTFRITLLVSSELVYITVLMCLCLYMCVVCYAFVRLFLCRVPIDGIG